jgi:cobalt-zinc-cadmium efflux system protein
MSTTEAALTAHLVRPQAVNDDAFLVQAAKDLHDRFEIEHATLQVERGDPSHPCRLEPDHVV